MWWNIEFFQRNSYGNYGKTRAGTASTYGWRPGIAGDIRIAGRDFEVFVRDAQFLPRIIAMLVFC